MWNLKNRVRTPDEPLRKKSKTDIRKEKSYVENMVNYGEIVYFELF